MNVQFGFDTKATEEDAMNTIGQNYAVLMDMINTLFPTRKGVLIAMYNDLEEQVMMAPASSVEHYHNAYVGGYLDHILRVRFLSLEVCNLWRNSGLDIDFTQEELEFVALHHDLGKVGFKGLDKYVPNKSEWHRKNQGKIYNGNPDIPFMLVPDLALFLLQKYNIPLTLNETLGIKLTDGLYDENNKPYFISYRKESSLRTNLPIIVHQADLMAAKFEKERWDKASGKGLKKFNT